MFLQFKQECHMQLEKLSDAEYDSMVLTIIKATRVGSFRVQAQT